ncbi:PLP-dependent aminotransferase family protein [Nonlabens ponticola]|uniref:Cystathionine beta-synthase n=1 Tax=Nonlabens ponticola TaxID=2496866 RepID=A0A3S9MZ58_9FLAO|nr:cystathionine beta-synthase [Nonlabens ponticola]AZQ44438.1 cystathionine beta-synthase [Nonlabens ponticola]
MTQHSATDFITKTLENKPQDWLGLTTHRLDIYEEKFAKVQFLEQYEQLFNENNHSTQALAKLPTAYDYIRLGHPLSCVLEWGISQQYKVPADNVISFQSQTVPILAVLRKNLLDNRKTLIVYKDQLPAHFDAETVRKVYGYNFELQQVSNINEVQSFNGNVIYLFESATIGDFELHESIDFYVSTHSSLGSVLLMDNSVSNYVSDVQHVRRRETVAMTPSNSLIALNAFVANASVDLTAHDFENDKRSVLKSVKDITGTSLQPIVGSSGLSVQYAIMMGLIDHAIEHHPNKPIKFVVPPNCYGGTNDQARRVAACLDNVEVVDLPVDGNNDMVRSVDRVLDDLAQQDAIPYIIAEIPTNPRVEVPVLEDLRDALSRKRNTPNNTTAIDPVFILDQTFCPNYEFLGEGKILSEVRTISYASGSKFPSGGRCTAGYAVGNNKVADLMEKLELHLQLCDNEATAQQYEILAEQLPSMNKRIAAAYENTREFVEFIKETLPAAKINFVSEELASHGFTPSVFSMDLPTKGDTAEEREQYKRDLNLKLIHKMIDEIPAESKFCVSYGQLKGCYWTVPATSTQGTTKEGDKDYIVRASLSPDLDLEKHKQVFKDFVEHL